jgi:hypothetical protein
MFEVYFIYLFGQYVMCLHVCEYVYVCGFSQKKKKSLCGEYIGVQVVFNNFKLTV